MIIDIHCHIVPEVDDGAKTMEISMNMCKMALEDGTQGIIATPHYIHGVIDNTRALVEEKVIELNKELKQRNIEIDIYPGCEAFISPKLPELVRDGRICTLNNTKYVLLELPMNSIPEYTLDVIYQLKLDGYIPIIAHPERNMEIITKPSILADLIRRGALVQVNASSLKGVFGKSAMDTAMVLLLHNMVHLLASDGHSTGGRAPRLSSSVDVIEQRLGPEALLAIMKNSINVLCNQPVECLEAITIGAKNKRNFFSRFIR